MNELFPVSLKLPQGFSYKDDFLSNDEEQALLDEVRAIDLNPMIFQGFEAKRRVASFGYDYSFDKRQLSKGKEIPAGLHSIVVKVANHLSILPKSIAELLVTEYPVGAVINWHRDAPPFDVIAGISLLSDCVFKLRPHEKQKQSRKSILSFNVRRRSLYVMSGDSREKWEHSTAPVKDIRYSITLRTLR